MSTGAFSLDRMATEFEDRVQTANNQRGWGQFLDGPIEHHQVGPYGTASGAIVRALAGRGQDALNIEVEKSLADWCAAADPNYARFWPQTLRLAFVLLALRASNGDVNLRNSLSDELLRRRLPGGLWGAYWGDTNHHDPSPRIVPSAMVLLSHGLFRDASSDIAVLTQEASRLESRIESGIKLSLFELAIAASAVLSIKRAPLTKKARRRVAALASELPTSLAELGVYFYEYRPAGGGNADVQFPRDYFIVPVAIVAALAGFLAGAPSDLHYRAHEIAGALSADLENGDGLYRPSPDNRAATKNQAWAALLLSMVDSAGEPRRWAGVQLALVRTRPDNWFTSIALPIVAWSAVVAIPILPIESGLARAVLSAAALIAGGIYPPNRILPKLVRRKEW